MRIGLRDMKTVGVMDRAPSLSPEELDELLQRPAEDFPVDAGGHTWKSKREVRIAKCGYLPQNDLPAFARGPLNRVGLFTKTALIHDAKAPKRINVTVNQTISVPARQLADAIDVKVMTRDERGQLKAIDADPTKVVTVDDES